MFEKYHHFGFGCTQFCLVHKSTWFNCLGNDLENISGISSKILWCWFSDACLLNACTDCCFTPPPKLKKKSPNHTSGMFALFFQDYRLIHAQHIYDSGATPVLMNSVQFRLYMKSHGHFFVVYNTSEYRIKLAWHDIIIDIHSA